MSDKDFPEKTAGRSEARKAAIEARSASARIGRMADDARSTIDEMRARRVDNHFADKMRSIIQGGRDR
jgi:hypothetical protein